VSADAIFEKLSNLELRHVLTWGLLLRIIQLGYVYDCCTLLYAGMFECMIVIVIIDYDG
jgi:hypothetical protein